MTREDDRREGFIGRWARLKQEARQPAALAVPAIAPAVDTPAAAVPAPGDRPDEDDGPPPPDLASIDAETDITPWLTRKVSDEWKNAALRQVWAATPGIRDFKGLQDYDWDFNNPDSIPGFGEHVNPETVREILANVFGPAPAAQQARAHVSEEEATAGDASSAAPKPESDSSVAPDAVRLSGIDGPLLDALPPQEADPDPEPAVRPARRGGRALPA